MTRRQVVYNSWKTAQTVGMITTCVGRRGEKVQDWFGETTVRITINLFLKTKLSLEYAWVRESKQIKIRSHFPIALNGFQYHPDV